MPTFTVPLSELRQGQVCLRGNDAHHIHHVLRLAVGEKIRLTDGAGKIVEGMIGRLGKEVAVKVTREIPAVRPYPLHLFVSLLKKDKMEWIVEKGVELNIESVHFVKTRHSVKTDISGEKWGRIERVASSAQKQCGRAYPLILHQPSSWESMTNSAVLQRFRNIFCCEKGTSQTLKEFWKRENPPPPLALWIGPEGGWDEKEIEMAQKKEFHQVTLGPLTLRSETAAICAVSSLIALAF